jgi:DNA-binding MarR family transcriptional regulator
MRKKAAAYSEFGYYLHRIVALLDKQGDRLFRTELGVSLRQFLLLRLIESAHGQAPSQQLIADRLDIAKSAVSRHIDIISRKGWVAVKTSESSRRQNELFITLEGESLLARAKELIGQSETKGFADISEADIATTLRTLRAVQEKLEAAV